ncbi:MAG TPA: MFS transporter, partial [Chitinophaga sp.]
LGGLCGPAVQGIISTQVPPTEQGELQGALTSVMSITAIIGPPLMTNLFKWFSRPHATIFFPGAPFLAAAGCCLLSLLLAMRFLRHYVAPK